MKKNRNISSILLAVPAILATVMLTNAYASDSYYIEIGKPASIEETHEQWSDLSKKYKSMLQKLTFYPKSIINEAGETSNIIQAGPISEKEKAQKICNRFFAKGIPCFVLEGVENSPPKIAIGMTQASNSSSPGGEFVFPWQGGNSANNVGRAPEVYSQSSDADVDVAQAIPVPLSDKTDSEYKNISNSPQIKSQQLPLPVELVGEKKAVSKKSLIKNFSASEFAPEETGSLTIERFSDEGEANKFWSFVNDEFPDMVHGMRIRAQRPATMDNKGGIQVKVYPFASGDAAAAFCNQTVNAFGIELECHYEVSNVQTKTQTGSSQHADGYVQRRNFQRRIPSEQHVLQSRRPSAISVQELPETGKSYWAQVAIAESQAEATNRWEDIKKRNKNLVKDVSSKMTSSSSSYAKYSFRLGAFDSEDDANDLCDKLQAKGVDCLVVSTR